MSVNTAKYDYGDPLRLSTTAGDAATNSARLAAACGAGKAVFITRPGTYYFALTGTGYKPDEYSRAYRTCVNLGNLRLLRLAPGVTFKIADDQMKTTGDNRGPLSLLSADGVTDLTIDGGGRFEGNTAGQTSWTGSYNSNLEKWTQQQGSSPIIVTSETGAFGKVRLADLTFSDWFANACIVEGDYPTNGGAVEVERLRTENCGEGPSIHDVYSAVGRDLTVVADTGTYTASDSSTKNKWAGDGIEFARCVNAKLTGARGWSRQGTVLPGGGSFIDFGGSGSIDIDDVYARHFQAGYDAADSLSIVPQTVRLRRAQFHDMNLGVQCQYPANYFLEDIQTHNCTSGLLTQFNSAIRTGFVDVRGFRSTGTGLMFFLKGAAVVRAYDCYGETAGHTISIYKDATYAGTPKLFGERVYVYSTAAFGILIRGLSDGAFAPEITLKDSRVSGSAGTSFADQDGATSGVTITA